jgi:hypothetical protein
MFLINSAIIEQMYYFGQPCFVVLSVIKHLLGQTFDRL